MLIQGLLVVQMRNGVPEGLSDLLQSMAKEVPVTHFLQVSARSLSSGDVSPSCTFILFLFVIDEPFQTNLVQKVRCEVSKS
jgi:hypothetical protein